MINYEFTDEQIIAAAKAGYESCRSFNVATGDRTQVPWEWVTEQDRNDTIKGVRDVATGRLLVEQTEDVIFTTVVRVVLEALMNSEESKPGV